MQTETKRTILIVEDETLVRMHGADVLQSAGFTVLEASSADEALEILKVHDEVQLLFSDVDMPGSMDGVELAAFVHAKWPTIKLLLTSGHRALDKANLPDDGEFVAKPWRENSLIETVQAALRS